MVKSLGQIFENESGTEAKKTTFGNRDIEIDKSGR